MGSELSDWLNSGGAQSFPFDHVGASVTGHVLTADVVQARSHDTKEPEFWPEGDKKNLVRIILETPLRDLDDPDDDGRRAVYVKTWGDQARALRAAIQRAQADNIEAGGTFTATYTGDGTATRGFPPKLYAYTYTKPSPPASGPDGHQPGHDPTGQGNVSETGDGTYQDPGTLAEYEAWKRAGRPNRQDPPF